MKELEHQRLLSIDTALTQRFIKADQEKILLTVGNLSEIVQPFVDIGLMQEGDLCRLSLERLDVLNTLLPPQYHVRIAQVMDEKDLALGLPALYMLEPVVNIEDRASIAQNARYSRERQVVGPVPYGATLEQVMRERGLTETELRKAAGLASGTIQKLIDKGRMPRVETRVKIVAALGLEEGDPLRDKLL